VAAVMVAFKASEVRNQYLLLFLNALKTLTPYEAISLSSTFKTRTGAPTPLGEAMDLI
jgi:hypothetical protein